MNRALVLRYPGMPRNTLVGTAHINMPSSLRLWPEISVRRGVQKLFSIENSYVENHPSSRKKFIYINNKNMTLRSRQHSPDELKGSCSSFPERAFLSHHSVTVHPTEHPRGKNEKIIENSIQQADEYKGAEKRQFGVNHTETTPVLIRLFML